MTKIRCVGCGNIIGGDIDIRSTFAYTCSCGANLFTFDGRLALPSSLITYLAYQKYGKSSPLGVQTSIPHIEYYIGYSEYMDDTKKYFIEQLKLAGSIPEDECQDKECKRRREECVARLQEAIADDYWRNMPDEQLAAHFRTPISKVRELKNDCMHIICEP